jgi:hypothetical protein
VTETEHALVRPVTASAATRPCELYATHYPVVVVTEGHHIHPVYLQNRVYGRIQDTELKWLCSGCHDAVHAWLYWLLGERARPAVTPPPRARAEAEHAHAWYLQAQLQATPEHPSRTHVHLEAQ